MQTTLFGFISPPGRHCDAACGLMFYRRFSFFNCRPCHSTTGARISTHVCIVFSIVPGLKFTKLSAGIKKAMGFIIMYWNCDDSLKGRCNGNRFLARVVKNWHTPSSFCALAFNIRWEYRNASCCVIINDDSSTSDKNFVNFASVTSEIF